MTYKPLLTLTTSNSAWDKTSQDGCYKYPFFLLFTITITLSSVTVIYCHTYITNFIWSYLHQFFDNSHGLKASLKPLKRPFDRYQSRLEAINNG